NGGQRGSPDRQPPVVRRLAWIVSPVPPGFIGRSPNAKWLFFSPHVDRRRCVKEPSRLVQERLNVQRDLYPFLGIAGGATGICCFRNAVRLVKARGQFRQINLDDVFSERSVQGKSPDKRDYRRSCPA